MAKKEPNSIPEQKRPRRFLTPRIKRKEVTAPVADAGMPRITNETVIQHREEVLKGARKYVYPLRHSRHKIVITTVIILTAVFIAFSSYILLSLYKFQSTSNFVYQVTKVLPLPVARVGGHFVSYESYLFELRHYIHYFGVQSEVDFTSETGKAQLADQRKKSLDKVVNYAYVQKIAKEKNITVSEQEVDNQIELLRNLSRLGTDNKVFEDVLKDYYGWSVSDFRRSIRQEILTNKVLQTLDTGTKARADAALAEIKGGSDFSAVAKKYSDDTATKDNGGQLGFLVSKTDRNIPIETINALYKLQPGQTSDVINIGYGLEIVKNLGVQDDKIKAARIFFSYQDINNYLNDYKDKQKAHTFIRVQQQ
ncbi:MAG: SurA N-terminal domain-containing protein [Candidatus Saccharimonadales bacterium]